MQQNQSIEATLAKLVPLSLYRVTTITDATKWKPANREAGIETTGREVRVHLHVSNAENGGVTLGMMAAEVSQAAREAGLKRSAPNQTAPNQITLTYQQPKRERDATPET